MTALLLSDELKWLGDRRKERSSDCPSIPSGMRCQTRETDSNIKKMHRHFSILKSSLFDNGLRRPRKWRDAKSDLMKKLFTCCE
jgi:hypothetical protein